MHIMLLTNVISIKKIFAHKYPMNGKTLTMKH